MNKIIVPDFKTKDLTYFEVNIEKNNYLLYAKLENSILGFISYDDEDEPWQFYTCSSKDPERYISLLELYRTIVHLYGNEVELYYEEVA